MQMWRPNAPNYVDEVIQHEGFSEWWAERVLSAQSYKNINFPSSTLIGNYTFHLASAQSSKTPFREMIAVTLSIIINSQYHKTPCAYLILYLAYILKQAGMTYLQLRIWRVSGIIRISLTPPANIVSLQDLEDIVSF